MARSQNLNKPSFFHVYCSVWVICTSNRKLYHKNNFKINANGVSLKLKIGTQLEFYEVCHIPNVDPSRMDNKNLTAALSGAKEIITVQAGLALSWN